MNVLNSILGADQDTSKNKGKTRGGTEKVQATSMHINCLF